MEDNTNNVERLDSDSWYDYLGIAKSFIWDGPVYIDQYLYLGNITHSFFLNTILNYNIKAIVNVTQNINNNYYYQKINYFNIPITDQNNSDISQYLEDSYQFIESQCQEGHNVLVHCIFGRSRSVAVCVYYLMKKYNITFDKAYQIIKKKKPFININKKFIQQLKEILV